MRKQYPMTVDCVRATPASTSSIERKAELSLKQMFTRMIEISNGQYVKNSEATVYGRSPQIGSRLTMSLSLSTRLLVLGF